MRCDENTALYLEGVYNGHTVQIEPNPALRPIVQPGIFCHATTSDSASRILREWLRKMVRNDIHLAPLHMNPRQEAYLKPSIRKNSCFDD